MEGNNNSYGTSWADQWDFNDSTATADENNKKKSSNGGGGKTAKYKQKVGEGLGKTKAVASTGAKKLKQGTSVGIQWIKEKYNKTAHKH